MHSVFSDQTLLILPLSEALPKGYFNLRSILMR
jgi:hypothetical protein